MAKDPVCGMNIDEKKTPLTARHEGTTYYFCAPSCRDAFTKHPTKFAGEKAGTQPGGADR
jgi:Cu+-exporting ATPase